MRQHWRLSTAMNSAISTPIRGETTICLQTILTSLSDAWPLSGLMGWCGTKSGPLPSADHRHLACRGSQKRPLQPDTTSMGPKSWNSVSPRPAPVMQGVDGSWPVGKALPVASAWLQTGIILNNSNPLRWMPPR